ncbi:MAG TPA: hypothetical protein DCQ26_08475 [Marinilabiliales bacterium]|nr:MAG: hypothetical protein A2W84_07980 [Bacteroidetes bacterium GWC2_40_13]OFX75761.1 MAG: hypothetical protein A2W96_09350 [Bacteroidetes bacterium GWD2_40_43]OFX94966.1 MAG: hypothetical protein A2W97_16490 [Bacteroidetes bacterium GWE2_40_63]OFY23478.1 MAG: hypothetical protein A2W88_08305 [Bacteroidetes bacterium GWF2_40_13]OFZ29396.1 MAG: hypothetical protein A2437_09295 [Bacteroidetes bacterium RIFOXYC2_FULL_40_12]HAM98634.1 hypothetical protein [Marinilabiliales bacterium]
MGKLIQKTANTSHPYTLPSRTKAITQPKTCQRVWLPKCTDRKQRIKHENTTRYIKHLAESANFKGSTFNKLCNGLIRNRFEMPNVSYTHPLAFIVKAHIKDRR